jgi:hypothetical protein
MMGMLLRCEPRLQQQLKLQQRLELRAPTPPEAVRGIEGLRVADEVLRKYEVIGMLIGGLAKELWHGVTDPEILETHGDVDVLLLSYNCRYHPKQWEEGVDWWVSHTVNELPTNGSSVGIFWQASLEQHALKIPSGLYLCPYQFLRSSIWVERREMGRGSVKGVRFTRRTPNILPILDELQLVEKWGRKNYSKANYCGK